MSPVWRALMLCVTMAVVAFPAPADPLEEQVQALLDAVRGKRVALLTDPTGVDSNLVPIHDRMVQDPDVELVAFFAHEHGLRANLQAGVHVDDEIDPYTGVPVHSLYGQRRAPTTEQLEGVDVLVFDCQDVGARFYVRNWTMTYAMESAAENGVEFIVFDRPNPIGAAKVEGPPLTFDAGLVGRVWPEQRFSVPTRTGLTVGELALMANGEWLEPKADLTVIPIPDYRRDQTFDDLQRVWILPSPNMPSLDTAIVYPGMCVFEATNLSEGRGTTKPFEFMGAPFVDGVELADALNAMDLPGVQFRAVWFSPTFSKHAGEMCSGVQVHVFDRDAFEPVRTGLVVLKAVVELYPEDVTIRSYASRLMGVRDLENRIRTECVDDIVAEWQEDLQAYLEVRERYLLYEAGQ